MRLLEQPVGVCVNPTTARRASGMTAALLAAVALVIGLLAATAAPASASTYTMTDLGNLGYPVSLGFGINANAQIAGRSYLNQTVPVSGCPPRHTCTARVAHAFLWSAGTITDLGSLGGIFSEGRAINSAGDVAGYSRTSTGNYRAFLDHNGLMTDLGSLAANGSSEAFAINNFGEVAGWTNAVNGGQHAFIYSGGKMTDLGTLGSNLSYASGMNNLHQVVGSSDLANGLDTHAFLWANGTIKDLGTLGGTQSSASAINDAGQIVGNAQTPSSADHPFIYSNGKMTDLGAFGIDTVPESINNSGVIVGQSDGHAFIHTTAGFQDLNKLIPSGSVWVLTDAPGINDTGQIVANAYNTTNGQTHAFLLNPA
jgi:probable HAF family extracellular repeat protein